MPTERMEEVGPLIWMVRGVVFALFVMGIAANVWLAFDTPPGARSLDKALLAFWMLWALGANCKRWSDG